MKSFIDRFSNLVKGTISGLDRIVFKGLVLPLMSPGAVISFRNSKAILNKSYKKFIMEQTKTIISYIYQYARINCGQSVTHIPSSVQCIVPKLDSPN